MAQLWDGILTHALDSTTNTLIVNGVSLREPSPIDQQTAIYAVKRLTKLLLLAPDSHLEFLARKGGVRILKQEIFALARTNTLLTALGTNPHRLTTKATEVKCMANSYATGVMALFDYGKPLYATYLNLVVGNAAPQAQLKDPVVAGSILEAIMGLCHLLTECGHPNRPAGLAHISSPAAFSIWEYIELGLRTMALQEIAPIGKCPTHLLNRGYRCKRPLASSPEPMPQSANPSVWTTFPGPPCPDPLGPTLRKDILNSNRAKSVLFRSTSAVPKESYPNFALCLLISFSSRNIN